MQPLQPPLPAPLHLQPLQLLLPGTLQLQPLPTGPLQLAACLPSAVSSVSNPQPFLLPLAPVHLLSLLHPAQALAAVSMASSVTSHYYSLQVGYRHFDTAMIYKSEGFLGEALKKAMEDGLVKREDLFVTSKLWCTDAYPEGVLPALQKSLSALQLDYLDLYLIHWPVRFKEGAGNRPKPDELMPLDIRGTWRALEACVRQGLTKAIGVSNFSSKKILDLLEFAEIPPAVNQVEMHPKWQQKLLRETCKKANIHVSAWSPLGAPLMNWGSPEILNDPIIKDIALKHGRTPAQVVLRWELDNGVGAIPKSFNKKRMVENIDVFGWHLTDEDHQNISGIEQKKNLDGGAFCSPVSGPYKKVQDIWDGEF